jgi:aconitase A
MRGWRFVRRPRDRRLAGKTFEQTAATLCQDAAMLHARELEVVAKKADRTTKTFKETARIDTPSNADYYLNGGIL